MVIGTTRGREDLKHKLLHLDYSEESALENLIARLHELKLSPNILINNAGLGLDPLPLSDLSRSLYHEIFSVNTIMPCELVRLCTEHFPLERVINIGSIMSLLPLPYYGLYGASKGALLDLTLSLRYELKRKGIAVCAVLPNLTQTKFTQKRRHLESLDKEQAQICAYIKSLNEKNLRHADSPQQVARVIVTALTAKEPKAVYYVSFKGYMSAFISAIMPLRFLYFLVTKIFKI